ncbi:pentapeptide repeat-containing protein [Mogibacterium timidum]|uniref:Pentapeptide repeat-containing protein n=1 Tax=Mogibacterium timidum TaxID=35519 RepID=A0A7Y9B055_9FIRM|nr:pentapeptide repeat-containing protein [Mogibacterium timidum]
MIVDVKWLTDVLNERQPEKTLDLSRKRICSVDLSGMNLSNIDFSCTRFENVDFTGANMDHCNVSRCFFVECSMRGVRLTNADASDASFRELDMQDSDFSGTNFYYAALEFINLENVKVNEKTKWFGDAVPQKGSFICWKVGANHRVI